MLSFKSNSKATTVSRQDRRIPWLRRANRRMGADKHTVAMAATLNYALGIMRSPPSLRAAYSV